MLNNLKMEPNTEIDYQKIKVSLTKHPISGSIRRKDIKNYFGWVSEKHSQESREFYPRKVPTIPGVPAELEDFFQSNVNKGLCDIIEGEWADTIESRFIKKNTEPTNGVNFSNYGLRLIDRKTNANIYRDSIYGIMLCYNSNGRELPLALAEFEFYEGSIVITQVSGVRSSNYCVDYNIPNLLKPLRWRELLMNSGYMLAKEVYSSSGSEKQKVYLIPSRLQRWLNSHHAKKDCPFDLSRAKKLIDRPARNVGFKEKDHTGMLFKKI